MNKKIKFGSLCVHDPAEMRTTKPNQLPIYPTSAFEMENIQQGIDIFKGNREGHIYGRYGNPTMETVAKKIAELEAFGLDMEVKGFLFSSGMAAISAVMMGSAKAGDKILTQDNLYGGTTTLLTKILQPLGIEPLFVNFDDLDHVEAIIKNDPKVQLIYLESPANPTLACIDLEKVAQIAQQYGKRTAIDNTFASPYLQQPLKYGIDLVIHSSTKYLNGHGNAISGAVVGKDIDFMNEKIWGCMKLLGSNGNPFDAWLLNNGMKTLELRMERHCNNADTVADFLNKNNQVALVNHPSLSSHPSYDLAKKQMRRAGGMLSFELKGGFEAGLDFMNKIRFCKIAPTLGDVDTLIVHPASMSHLSIPKAIREKVGITDGLIRISVGIENVEDIITDLDHALKVRP